MLAPHNHYVIVSGDQIRLALYGCRYSSYGEGFVFATMQTMTRTLLASGYNVIIDETNTTKESCRRILEIDPTAKPIFILTRPEICIERAKATNQEDLAPVIEAQWGQLQNIYENQTGSANIEEAYHRMMVDIKNEIFDRWGSFTVPRLVKEV
jgi:predicted kinase